MLAHSPPLPLTIYYHTIDQREVTAEDESSILLALSYRDRVRHIYFWMLPNVGKSITAMEDQFPVLERMYIHSRTEVVLPVTFEAPNLRHLRLWRASHPIGSPLLTNTTGLVTLSLLDIRGSAFFPPSYILTRISLMAQLERLSIGFHSPLRSRDHDIELEGQSHQNLDTIILSNLQLFEFQGVSAYLDGLIARISAPSLNTLRVYLFNQPSFTVPRLSQFVQTSKNLTFSAVQVHFSALSVSLYAVPLKWDTPLLLKIWWGHLDSQVASAAQLFGSLSPILSVVEQVTFSYRHKQSSEFLNDADQIQWRELLMLFANAKVIHVEDHLVGKIFRSLPSPSDNGEPPLELLPNLKEVGYSGGSDVLDALTTFLNERQAAGHPISLRLLNPSIFDEHPAPTLYESVLE
jgi:hypothetical protein